MITVDIEYEPADYSVGINESYSIVAQIGKDGGTRTYVLIDNSELDPGLWQVESVEVVGGTKQNPIDLGVREFEGLLLSELPDVQKAVLTVWAAQQARNELEAFSETGWAIESERDSIYWEARTDADGNIIGAVEVVYSPDQLERLSKLDNERLELKAKIRRREIELNPLIEAALAYSS